MKVTLEKLPASQVSFDIEIEGAKSQAIYDRTIKELSKSINVPGFRPGKAPKELMIRQIGKDKLKASVLEEVIQDTLNNILKDHEGIQAIGSFDLATPFEDLKANFTVGNPLQFKALIDVHPAINLTDYQNLTVAAAAVEPDLTQVDKTLHEYQLRKSTLVPAEGRGAEMGDVVTVNFKALDANGQEISQSSETNTQLNMAEGEFIDAVITGLVGVKVDETTEILATIPADFFNQGDPEQTVTFIVSLTDIKARELPELDDEFAKSISQKETIADLRAFLAERIIADAQEATAANIHNALINAVVANMEVEVPNTMVMRESERLVQQQIEWLTQTPEGEKLAKQIVNREFIQNLIANNQPDAIASIKKSLAIAHIASLEDITAPRSEVLRRATELQQEINDKSIDFEVLKQVAEDEIITEEVMAWLKSHNQVEMVSATSEEISEEMPTLETAAEVVPDEIDKV